MMQIRRPASFQTGVSMIEVLVSLTVVAFGLLGLAGLQARSMSFQKDSFDRKAAAEVAAQFTERVRANYDGFRAGKYNRTMQVQAATPQSVPVCADPQNCNAEEIADKDWAMWQIDLRRRLPVSAAFMASPQPPTSLTMVLAWQEGNADRNQTVDLTCQAVGVNDASFRCVSWTVFP
jgi:type IV pilus assembly protein PilV